MDFRFLPLNSHIILHVWFVETVMKKISARNLREAERTAISCECDRSMCNSKYPIQYISVDLLFDKLIKAATMTSFLSIRGVFCAYMRPWKTGLYMRHRKNYWCVFCFVFQRNIPHIRSKYACSFTSDHTMVTDFLMFNSALLLCHNLV